MKLQVSEIINPVHPNRATKLFGGVASGILNWNDLKYPHIYSLREKIRATFFSAAEITLDGDSISAELADLMNLLIGSIEAQFPLREQIADYSTDPSVTSVFSTMLDQSHEHIHTLRRALEYYGQPRDNIFDGVLHDDKETTVPVLLERIRRLYESKLSILGGVPVGTDRPGLHEVFSRILQDRHNHAEFLAVVYKLSCEEHKMNVPPLYPFDHFVYDEGKATAESKEVNSSGIDLDGFDDL